MTQGNWQTHRRGNGDRQFAVRSAGVVGDWPNNTEAEECVVGSVLMNPECIHDVAGWLKPEHFWRSSVAEAWRAILGLYADGRPIDGVSLAEAMRRAGTFDDVGGHDSLSGFMAGVPAPANIRHYAGIVREKWVARELKMAALAMADEAVSNRHTADEIVDNAQAALFRISEEFNQAEAVRARSSVADAHGAVLAGRAGAMGISTGIRDLDLLVDGLKAEQLVVIGARPSIGKTALGLNLFTHCVTSSREPAVFVSLEMTNAEIGRRLLVATSRVDNGRLRNHEALTAADREALAAAEREWAAAPALIDDSPTIGLAGLMALARRWKSRVGLKVMFVDYLQLVQGDGNNRQEEIASVSRILKRIARECEVAVVCLSQLNRNVEQREDKRPRLSDIRESGATEQDADVVLLMHRPDYYKPTEKPGYCELVVAKNRNGPTGSVDLRFRKELGRFEPWGEPAFDEAAAEF